MLKNALNGKPYDIIKKGSGQDQSDQVSYLHRTIAFHSPQPALSNMYYTILYHCIVYSHPQVV